MGTILKGRVVSGTKQGAYFVSKYRDKLVDLLGFEPFPGTLNIELPLPPQLPVRSRFISSWTEDGVEYGFVSCYPCTIKRLQCAVVIPDKARHSNRVIEVISPFALKTKFGLKDGDYLELELA
jgi:riboflavin kinase